MTMSKSTGTTSRADFDVLSRDHRVIPVIRELFADGETPVGIYRKLAIGKPGSFLLESVVAETAASTVEVIAFIAAHQSSSSR